ncbi:MAG: L-threonylcarbamoyladenylate synthase [Hyphomicrobiaceae bacterium]
MPIVPVTPQNIARAAALLREGQLVAFPTETVYGLGADATNGIAVARIFEAKGRPRFNPLIAHVASVAQAEEIGRLGAVSRRLAHVFWPGPLTLVVERQRECPVSELATAGLDTIAIRVPSHPVAQMVLSAAGRPVAAPSANRSGHVSATDARHVDADLGPAVALVLDGGPTEHGVESTVIDVSGERPTILRPGAITRQALAEVLGDLPGSAAPVAARPMSPGQLESHYAPTARVRLDATSVAPGEALLAFGEVPFSHDGPMVNLSETGDLRMAAATLFAALRELDRSGATTIAVMPIPGDGLGEAINDRLARSAAPR